MNIEIHVGDYQATETLREVCEDVCNIAHAYSTLSRENESVLEAELRYYLNQKINLLRIFLNNLEEKEQ